MSTRKCVRRRVGALSDVLNFEELVETGGIAFPDGDCIELVKDNLGSLAFLDSKWNKILQRVDRAGQKYVPPKVSPSVLEVLTLPTKRTDCGSTVEMFTQICRFFIDHGVSEDSAKISTYFAFGSWFPENHSVGPCLVITGTEAEARVFLQLLSCVVRHALPLAEINVATFDSIPMHIQPTMLIGYVSPSMWRILSVSNYPHTPFPIKHELLLRALNW